MSSCKHQVKKRQVSFCVYVTLRTVGGSKDKDGGDRGGEG